MLRRRRFKSWGMLVAGLTLGLLLGGAITVGVVAGRRGHGDRNAASLEKLEKFEQSVLPADAARGGLGFPEFRPSGSKPFERKSGPELFHEVPLAVVIRAAHEPRVERIVEDVAELG